MTEAREALEMAESHRDRWIADQRSRDLIGEAIDNLGLEIDLKKLVEPHQLCTVAESGGKLLLTNHPVVE